MNTIGIMLTLASLVTAGLIAYGIYFVCSDPSEHEEDSMLPHSNNEATPSNSSKEDLETSHSPSENNDEDDVIQNIWDSCHLDEKYNEMKKRKGLKEYLQLGNWKNKIRRRFKNILYSNEYKNGPIKYINSARSKRDNNEYAVVEDTVLNLLEYYELTNSQEQGKVYELKEIKRDSQDQITYQ